jgi:FkbM family methyltransferase
MIKRIIKSIIAVFGIEIRRNKSFRYNKLEHFAIPQDEWEMKDGSYYLKVLDIAVRGGKDSVLIAGYAMAKRIVQYGQGRFFYNQKNQLQLTIQGVHFLINYTDELFVVHEVFLSGDYNIKSADDLVVIDIGLNIGATSLFLSKQEKVKRIYAYELFKPTYEAALLNFEMNDSSKIKAFNVGLGAETKQFKLPYTPASKARMGLSGVPANEQFSDVVEVEVSMKDVAEEIIRLHNSEPNIKKFCKIDCEGAEYEILDRLFQKNAAQLIDRYIIEWHTLSTDNIEKQFLSLGFDLVKSTNPESRTGLIYAFKNK